MAQVVLNDVVKTYGSVYAVNHVSLTIEDGGETRVVDATDTDMPAPLRPLIAWLSDHSAPGGAR